MCLTFTAVAALRAPLPSIRRKVSAHRPTRKFAQAYLSTLICRIITLLSTLCGPCLLVRLFLLSSSGFLRHVGCRMIELYYKRPLNLVIVIRHTEPPKISKVIVLLYYFSCSSDGGQDHKVGAGRIHTGKRSDKNTLFHRIAIVDANRCKPKRCAQECKKVCANHSLYRTPLTIQLTVMPSGENG